MKINEILSEFTGTIKPKGTTADPAELSASAGSDTGVNKTQKLNAPGQQPKPLSVSSQPVDPNKSSPNEIDQIGKMKKDAAALGSKLGMNPQQTQKFSDDLIGSTPTTPQQNQKTISPTDMQKALPKPGSNLNVKGIGNTRVLPTSPDQKGIKLDTSKKLGYPITVDPRDLNEMRMHHILGRPKIMVSNEEKKFIASHRGRINPYSLHERDEVIARNLVRKGVYDIDEDTNELVLRQMMPFKKTRKA